MALSAAPRELGRMIETENVDELARDLAADLAFLRADIVKLADSVTTLVKAQVARSPSG